MGSQVKTKHNQMPLISQEEKGERLWHLVISKISKTSDPGGITHIQTRLQIKLSKKVSHHDG